MARIAYVNGRYMPLDRASVSIEDRGYQFADGVYEVIAVRRTCLIDAHAHMMRLKRSLEAIEIPMPIRESAFPVIFQHLIRRNHIRDGILYLQITRGTAKRDHAYPEGVKPNLVITCRRFDFEAVKIRALKGVSVHQVSDERWARCDIKTISLLPNAMAKEAARRSGAFEAMMVDRNGLVSEGSSTNIWIVKACELITRATSDNILAGITRDVVLSLAKEQNLKVTERAFTPEEAHTANEMFLTSSTSGITAIIKIDDTPIADGTPGPISTALMHAYFDRMDNG